MTTEILLLLIATTMKCLRSLPLRSKIDGHYGSFFFFHLYNPFGSIRPSLPKQLIEVIKPHSMKYR